MGEAEWLKLHVGAPFLVACNLQSWVTKRAGQVPNAKMTTTFKAQAPAIGERRSQDGLGPPIIASRKRPRPFASMREAAES